MALRAAVVAGLVLLLGACGSDDAPAGFESVASAHPRYPGDACPDLAGSYALSPEDAALFLDRSPPDNAGHPVRLAIADNARSGSAVRPAYWAMDRDEFLAFAQDFRQRDPGAYARWRNLLLREQLPREMLYDTDGWIAATTRLGPFQAVPAGLTFMQCQDHWALVKSEMTADWSQEQEIWLGRNEQGALLLKTVTYDLTSYSLWGGSTSFLRSNARYDWQQRPVFPNIDTTALSAADLPADPVTARTDSVCPDPTSALVTAQQFLLAHLPPAGELTFFQPQFEGRAVGNARCGQIPIEIAVRVRQSADFRRLEQAIEAQAGYRMEQLQIGPASTSTTEVDFVLIMELD
ncbi:MAG: hypothetical protein R3F15_06530 [Lysobacterales bacterium]